jgi:hypothetical protein
MLSQLAAAYYFAHFLIILPIVRGVRKAVAAARIRSPRQ